MMALNGGKMKRAFGGSRKLAQKIGKNGMSDFPSCKEGNFSASTSFVMPHLVALVEMSFAKKHRVLPTTIVVFLLLSTLITVVIPSTSAGTVDRIEIDQQPPIMLSADSQMQFTATMYDSSNNTLSEIVEWSATNGSIDGAGLFTPWATGNVSISANSGVASTFVNISVEAGWPSSLTIESNQSEIGVDSTAQLTALLVDARGNEVQGHALTWSPSQGTVNETGVWFPASVGVASIEVHWGELSATMNITVITGQPANLILPTGLSVRYGQSITIVPEIYDSHGNLLSLEDAGSLQWAADSGVISQTGSFTGNAVGIWNISCSTANGLFATVEISVISAAIESLELVAENRVFRADEAVEIRVIRSDVYGNVEDISTPLSNWSYQSGALRYGENATEWLPTVVGNWTLSVVSEGFTASITIEVVHGYASELLLVTENQRVSADDDAVIHMQARDIRNNRWIVTGTWEAENSLAESWLASFGTWANFAATKTGEWQITGSWFDEEQQQIFSATVTIEVYAGELSTIILQGDGATVSADEVLDLAPTMFDSDGNQIGTVLLNWTVDGEDKTTDFRLHRGVYYPYSVGLHEIRAQAASAYASVMIQVTHGQARTLSISVANNLSINSGEEGEITFTVYAQDLSGNSFLVDELTWDIPEYAGEIRAGGDSGEWILSGKKAGDWRFTLYSGDAQFDLLVKVNAGLAARIEVVISSDYYHQGDEMILDVRVYDSFNNSLKVIPSDMTVSSTAGPASHVSEGSWKVMMDTGGSDHAVTVRYDELTEQKFFDVQGALLGGALGSSDAVVLGGTMFMALILIFLVLAIRRGRRDENATEGEKHSPILGDSTLSSQPPASTVSAQPQENQPEATETSQPGQPQSGSTSPASTSLDTASAALETPAPADPAKEAAQRAKATGVMVAAEGTTQGQSGWYYDTTGTLTNWEVDAEGRWNRIQ